MLTSLFWKLFLFFYIISLNTYFFNDNDTYLNHDDTLLFTMTLIFKISVIVFLSTRKLGGFESLHRGFCVYNFDTMKRFVFAKALQQATFGKKKRNASIVSILAFQYGWGGRIRTYECSSQSAVSYRLTTPQY